MQITVNTFEVCVGLDGHGSIVKVYNTPNEMNTDTNLDVVSTGVVSAVVTDYTEYAVRPLPKYVECGCCDCYHRVEYTGNCRNDEERFSVDELDEKHGYFGWEEAYEFLQ